MLGSSCCGPVREKSSTSSKADQLGCHIITVTHDLLKKLSNLGKDLTEFSLDTVKMFFNDGQAAGFAI